MTRVEARITEISTMRADAVRKEWTERYGEPAPSVLGSLLHRALAHAEQEAALGALLAVARKSLEAMARGDAPVPVPSIKLEPGTRLVREWNGHVHNVLVTADGVQLEGKNYKSLSDVACTITGAHWSGPRFFGLRRPLHAPSRGRQHG